MVFFLLNDYKYRLPTKNKFISSFFYLCYSVNESITDHKDIKTKTNLDITLDNFTVLTDARNVNQNSPYLLTYLVTPIAPCGA